MEHHIKFHFNNVSKKFFSFNYQNLKTLMITTEFRIFFNKIGNNYPFYKISMTLDYNILKISLYTVDSFEFTGSNLRGSWDFGYM